MCGSDICEMCGAVLSWQECPECGGTGLSLSSAEKDALPQPQRTCLNCGGAGGWDYCPNAENHRWP